MSKLRRCEVQVSQGAKLSCRTLRSFLIILRKSDGKVEVDANVLEESGIGRTTFKNKDIGMDKKTIAFVLSANYVYIYCRLCRCGRYIRCKNIRGFVVLHFFWHRVCI